MKAQMRRRSWSASTLLLARNDPLSPSLSSVCLTRMRWSIRSSFRLLRLMLRLCSTLRRIPVAPWVNSSVTVASTPSSSMTIFRNRLWPTDKCRCCCVVPLVVRPTPATCFTFTRVCSNVLQKCPTNMAVVLSPLCPWLKLRWVSLERCLCFFFWFLCLFFFIFYLLSGWWRVGLHPNQRHLYHWRSDLLGDGAFLQRHRASCERWFVRVACRLGCPDEIHEAGKSFLK